MGTTGHTSILCLDKNILHKYLENNEKTKEFNVLKC